MLFDISCISRNTHTYTHLELRQDLAALLLVQGHPVLAAQQKPPRGASEVHPVGGGMRRDALLRHLVREVFYQDLGGKGGGKSRHGTQDGRGGVSGERWGMTSTSPKTRNICLHI